jgi:Ubiquitin/SUMO-activating enzyme ubiquitin-like domain
LLRKVIKGRLGFNLPSIRVGASTIYEEGEDIEKDEEEFFLENLSKTLCMCPAGGVMNDTVLAIEDFSQDLEVGSFLIFIIGHRPPTCLTRACMHAYICNSNCRCLSLAYSTPLCISFR